MRNKLIHPAEYWRRNKFWGPGISESRMRLGAESSRIAWMLPEKLLPHTIRPRQAAAPPASSQEMEGLFWEKLNQKSYKIMNLRYSWDQARSWTEPMGIIFKCACMINLLPTPRFQNSVSQVICYLDSHGLGMKLKHHSLASEKKNVQVQSLGNSFREPNINLLSRATVHSTTQ